MDEFPAGEFPFANSNGIEGTGVDESIAQHEAHDAADDDELLPLGRRAAGLIHGKFVIIKHLQFLYVVGKLMIRFVAANVLA